MNLENSNNIEKRPHQQNGATRQQNGGPRPQNGDKEYEQYIDEEDEQHNAVLNLAPPKQRHNPGNPNLGNPGIQRETLVDVLNRQHQEEESYSYYDNQEDHPDGHGGMRHQNIIPAAPKEHHASTLPIAGHLNSPIVSPTKLYLFVTAFTVVILYFMFKFVRRRRVVIRYYHH